MTLRSALQDLRENTLTAVSGLLAKLTYLGSLRRREGGYKHWGMALIHGQEASDRALKAAHSDIVATILRTPIAELEEDLGMSIQHSRQNATSYIEEMRRQREVLVPSPTDSVTARHLNSVLTALSSLEKHRKAATPSTSSPLPPPAR
jgi:hypothetical protein